MKKNYLLVQPTAFYKYGSVDIDGNYPKVGIENFNVEDKMNYVMIELSSPKNIEVGKEYLKTATILLTNEFDNKLDAVYSMNEEGKLAVSLKSDTIGLFTKHPLIVEDVKCIPSKIPGMMNYMAEDTELMQNYITSLDCMIQASKFYKELYDETIDGPSYSLMKSIKKQYKHSK